MKKIGLLGGMSWESSLKYYKIINEEVKNRLGGFHSARVVLNSVDFEEIEKLQHKGEWDKTAKILSKEAKYMQDAGCDFVLICTNTMHKVADIIQKHTDIPLLHIADATAEVLMENGIQKVGLLGTAFTMEQDFYKGRLRDKFGLEVIVPNKKQRELIHKVIYDELCLGEVKEASKKEYLNIIEDLNKNGVQGIILGCTEIGMLVTQDDIDMRLFDTTVIHAKKAVDMALDL